ncbi:tetratricopeptide repeat protein [Azospirillum halopraeferens]|uniref:O-linked N-acetylglucosamine transferase family protein n=1 Tax=Azospirillum halopraeferens TaxID=34010 RepID=UPI000404A107|nr:tetratricopeptide repeat protein [Azospirillum halopraeferens]
MKPSRRPKPAAGVDNRLARAVALHRDGRLDDARTLYEAVLRGTPGQPDALHLLGLIDAATGRAEAGIARIRRAVEADGRQPLFHLNLGRLLEAGGHFGEAAAAYAAAARLAPLEPDHHRLAAAAAARAGRADAAAQGWRGLLALAPDHAEAASCLGDALYDGGRPLPAAAWYGRAVALHPGLAAAAFNRGAALRDAGRPGEALAAFRDAAARAPLLVQAHEQTAGLCHAGGDTAGAAAACRRVLALVPDHGEAAKVLGDSHADAGAPEAAVRWLARAVRLLPDAADALRRLAGMEHGRGRAAAAAAWYRRALALEPAHADGLSGLAVALAVQGRDDAILPARRAVRLAPGDATAAANAGSALQALRRTADALPRHRRALALEPANAVAWINVGMGLLESGAAEEAVTPLERALIPGAARHEALARSNLGVALMALGRNAEAAAQFRAALERAPGDATVRSNLLFCLCFDETADLDAVYAEHRRFERFVPPPPPPSAAPPSVPAAGGDPDRRLRVGYLSPDFQRYPGPGYHFLLPLIEGHDRRAVEVTCYHNDVRHDAATDRFRAAADRWRAVAGLDDGELEALIRADGIDVLVDCDGHMSRNRMPLFLRRPAPVQVSLPLYPNTTGLSAMDYQLADRRVAPPGADARRSERLIRLPGCVLCYRPAESPFAPPPRPPAETAGVFTFGSFNNITKVNAPTIALWARVLHAVPGARLLLKWRGLDPSGGLGRRLLDAFAALGVGRERLLLRGITPDPYEDYVRVDVALDPVFANGGTTICDALWMGVPVLNRAGEAMISRWGATLLGAVGLDALVTGDDDAYVALAVRLAGDPAFLAAQRDGLRARVAGSALMDEAGYARSVEAAFRTAWRRRCAGLPPAAIDVPDGADVPGGAGAGAGEGGR